MEHYDPSDESMMQQYQREWEEDLERTGFRRSGGWSLRETSDKIQKLEDGFYRNQKRTSKGKAAMDAAVFAMHQAIERDKKRRMSSKIIPFDLIERKRSMSQLAENKKEVVTQSAGSQTDMSNPFSSLANFQAAQRMAMALSESSLIPKEYQKNVPNCLIALEISQRLRASALMVMQNLYIVHGKPGWSAQYIISAINSCGKFSPLRFKFDNDKKPTECQAYAIELRTGEILYGTNITMEMANAEGWVNKTGSKWKTMPEQMLRYRSASFFGKVYAPEILMGFQTTEEIEDSQAYHQAKEVRAEVHVQSDVIEVKETEPKPEIIPEPVPEIPAPLAAEAYKQEMPWDKYRDGYQSVK